MTKYDLLRRADDLLGRLTFFLFSAAGIARRREKTGPEKLRKILCLKLWGLGNLAVIYPLIRELKEKFKDSRLFFLTFDLNRGFLEKNSSIERVIYLKCSSNPLVIARDFFRLVRFFRKEKLDLLVNFETFNNASALFAYLTRARLRVGLNNKYEKIFYTHPVDHDSRQHISRVFSGLLEPLGIRSSYDYFRFFGEAHNAEKVMALLRDSGVDKFICVHVGTSRNFLAKRYPETSFCQLAGLLMERYGLPLVFTGTAAETPAISRITDKLKYKGKTVDLSGKLTVWDFVELSRRSCLFVSCDTGPLHIAASVGTNIAAIFGPTSPVRYGPLNANSLVFYKNVGCSPCCGTRNINGRCGRSHECLDFPPRQLAGEISGRFPNV